MSFSGQDPESFLDSGKHMGPCPGQAGLEMGGVLRWRVSSLEKTQQREAGGT